MFEETENNNEYSYPEDNTNTWEDSSNETWESPYNYSNENFNNAPSMQALQTMQTQLQQQSDTINQINNLLNPKSEEELQQETQANLNKELEEVKILKQQMQELQQQNAINQTKQDLANMQAKYNNFNPQEVIKVLKSLPPQMALALDNPQGWEMIHLSRFNMPKADVHLNQYNAGASGQPQDEVMKAFAEGRLSNEQIGKLF